MIVVCAIVCFMCIFAGVDAANKGNSEVATMCIIIAAISAIGAIAYIINDAKNSSRSYSSPTKVVAKPRIVRTQLLSVDGIKQSVRSGTVSGAVVGGILAGGLGAVVGAMSNTRERQYNVGHEYTFLVMYDNGNKSIETVRDRDQSRLEELVSKLVVDREPAPEEKKPAVPERKMAALPKESEEYKKCPHCGALNASCFSHCNACGHYLNR